MPSVTDTSALSLIKPLGYQQDRSCGYCKKDIGKSSYYASSSNMRVEHYQALVDRGWRRSGKIYYKPDLTHSCCPHYTIRLDAAKFQASKGQRQALNKWNRYVLGTEYMSQVAKLCPRSREEKRRRKATFDLQGSVHASEYASLDRPVDPKTKKYAEPAHRFEVSLESDSFSLEKFDMFLSYQRIIHKESESRWTHESFKRFLAFGLDRKLINSDGVTQKLGSHHQCYRLDGKLIAVAVLDLLPHGVSSVYLFYDPEYEDWELGKLGALREIALTREGQYQYYYMGYYIHSCVKMRYKASFRPTYILDPESLDWNLLDQDLLSKLSLHHYFSPSGMIKRLAIGPHINGTFHSKSPPPEAPPSNPGPEPTPVTAIDPTALNVELDLDSDESGDSTTIPCGSLFDHHVPGILTLAEVEQRLDLNKWKLKVRNTFIEMEDLNGWEEGSMTDPQGLKGIVAELAAALGEEVTSGASAVDLF